MQNWCFLHLGHIINPIRMNVSPSKKFPLLFLYFLAIVALFVLGGFSFRQKGKTVPTSDIRSATPPVVLSEPPLSSAPAPTTVVSSDPTLEWKTYRNEKYRFEMKYPNDWKDDFEDPYYGGKSILTLTSPEVAEDFEGKQAAAIDISILVSDAPSSGDLGEDIEHEVARIGEDFVVNKKRATINGYDAYIMTVGGEGTSLHVYFKNNKKLLIVIFNRAETMDELAPTEKQILSTFHFF